jgi:hypothetical protein
LAEITRRPLPWGTAIVAAFLIFFGLVVIFGIAPSQFITTVNKSYGRVPNSRQSRFARDLVSGGYHVVLVGWLVVGAYHIQRLSQRAARVLFTAVLLALPCLVFALVPSVLHSFLNAFVARQNPADRPGVLYDVDLWVYTGYWVATLGLFTLLTPGWIFGLKKFEEHFSGERARTSPFGRPVVTPS